MGWIPEVVRWCLKRFYSCTEHEIGNLCWPGSIPQNLCVAKASSLAQRLSICLSGFAHCFAEVALRCAWLIIVASHNGLLVCLSICGNGYAYIEWGMRTQYWKSKSRQKLGTKSVLNRKLTEWVKRILMGSAGERVNAYRGLAYLPM